MFRVSNARLVRRDALSSVANDPQLPSERCESSKTCASVAWFNRKVSNAKHVGLSAIWEEPGKEAPPPRGR
jgi:hypothetical protein